MVCEDFVESSILIERKVALLTVAFNPHSQKPIHAAGICSWKFRVAVFVKMSVSLFGITQMNDVVNVNTHELAAEFTCTLFVNARV